MPWSIAFLTTCMSGSVIFSTIDLSSSVSEPVSTSSMSLPSSRPRSWARRVKRLNVSPIGTMRSFRARSRTSSTICPIVEAASIVSTSAARRAAGPGARDHQLSDQGDQLVELVGAHAHEVALDRLALLDQVLLLERGIYQLVLHGALADEDFADPVPFSGLAALFLEALLQGQAFLELAPGEDPALYQQLAQASLVLGQGVDQVDVVGDPAVWRKNAYSAILAQVLEHVFYGFLGHRAFEIQLHAEIAGLGIHVGGS